MNVEVYEFWLNLKEKCCDRVGSVREKALTAVFDCLNQRIFLDATAVYENVDLLSVIAVDAWLSDYERITPF